MYKYKVYIAGDMTVLADDVDKAVKIVEEQVKVIPKQFNIDVFEAEEEEE
jgi:hypothetical protein